VPNVVSQNLYRWRGSAYVLAIFTFVLHLYLFVQKDKTVFLFSKSKNILTGRIYLFTAQELCKHDIVPLANIFLISFLYLRLRCIQKVHKTKNWKIVFLQSACECSAFLIFHIKM
jgi:hypothetical protein